jgi:hypothetical protein
MCFPLFHKWTKWSKPTIVEYDWHNVLFDLHGTANKLIQDRSCEKCGKHQMRTVSVS